MMTATKAKTLFKATIDRDPFLAVVSRVRGIVERKGTIPILNNVKLEAGDGRLTVTATDLDMQIIDSAPCEGEGEITVPAEHLGGLLQKLPAGADVDLTLSNDDPRLVLRCGRSRYLLPVLPATDFPTFDTASLGAAITIDSDALAMLLAKTEHAISTEATRYYLCGVYLHPMVVDGEVMLRATATQGHMLAVADVKAPEGYTSAQKGLIVPRKTIREIGRLLQGAGETVLLRLGENRIQVTAGETTLTSKVIDGQYPDYQRTIPLNNDRIVSLDKALLVAAIERSGVINTERGAYVTLAFSSGALTLKVRNMESGAGDESLEAAFEGEPFAVGFNGRYLLETLARVEAETVEMAFHPTETIHAVILGDPSNKATTLVVMSLRA